jgi:hypothetical protein
MPVLTTLHVAPSSGVADTASNGVHVDVDLVSWSPSSSPKAAAAATATLNPFAFASSTAASGNDQGGHHPSAQKSTLISRVPADVAVAAAVASHEPFRYDIRGRIVWPANLKVRCEHHVIVP